MESDNEREVEREGVEERYRAREIEMDGDGER